MIANRQPHRSRSNELLMIDLRSVTKKEAISCTLISKSLPLHI